MADKKRAKKIPAGFQTGRCSAHKQNRGCASRRQIRYSLERSSEMEMSKKRPPS